MPENDFHPDRRRVVAAREGQTILEVARGSRQVHPHALLAGRPSTTWAPAASASWRSPESDGCCPRAPLRCRTA